MTKTDSKEVSVYEVGYHLVPTLSENDVADRVDRVAKALAKLDASTLSEGQPELIELAYTMSRSESGERKDFDTAYFGWVKFEAVPEAIAALDETLKGMNDILRFIIVKTTREEFVPFIGTEAEAEVEETPSEEAESETEDSSDEETEAKEEAPSDNDNTDELNQKIDELVVE